MVREITIFVIGVLLLLPVLGGTEENPAFPTGTLPRTGQIVSYDSQGNEIDFENSGQDGEFQRGMPWPEPRFTYNGDGTVTDKMTGLMWLKDGNCFGKLSWLSAGKSIEAFNEKATLGDCTDYSASYSDWSLPSREDMASLLNADEKVVANYLNLKGFAAMQAELYWTGSRYLNVFSAWSVDLDQGGVSPRGKLEKHFIVPVRHLGPERLGPVSDDAVKGDDQKLVPVSVRFVDNGDGTVSDSQTNLMWLKDAGCFSHVTWQGALDGITNFNQHPLESDCLEYRKKYDNWTLANRVEMRSLLDYTHDFPAMTSGHPFQNITSSSWTSTSVAQNPEKSFVVDMYTGKVGAQEKSALLTAWPVRDVMAKPILPRKISHSGIGTEIPEKFVLDIVLEMRTALRWPPEPRFFENGDGTSMDRLTGITWLTDGLCFQKLSWEEIFTKVADFNSAAEDFACEGYDATFGDWMVPTVEDLHELINTTEKDSVAWLNSQGVHNLQSGGDYWSATETVANLYYADVISLKTGKIRNYPKSLKFFFWPHRVLPKPSSSEPLLNITANAVSGSTAIEKGGSFTIALYLHTFGIRVPADFWVWYDTPEGQQVWLSGIRTWQSEMTPIYQGNLFNLKNYEIIKVQTNSLEAGDYTLHFAVDFEQNGIFDNMHFEHQVVVSIGIKEQPLSGVILP